MGESSDNDLNSYAAVNGYLELNLLKDRQIKDSTPSRRRILRYRNFRIGES